MTNRDFRDLFSALNGAEVRYLVVGAYAVTFHARPRFTKDLDLWIDPDPANAGRAWKALAAFGAPVGDLRPSELTDPGLVFQIGVPPVRVDILTSLDGLEFAEAWPERFKARMDGLSVPVLSRAHLIRNKRAAGRLQDLAYVEWLEKKSGEAR